MKKLFISTIFCAALFTSHAQEKDPAIIKEAVESKNYIFNAQWAYPLSMNSRNLTPGYTLTIMGDSIVSYLPYFGRAYTAPIGSTENGLMFTLNNATYTTRKKGEKWNIAIVPKNRTDIQQLNLTIFENGKASLVVISSNRQNISFDGYIEKGKIKEKKGF